MSARSRALAHPTERREPVTIERGQTYRRLVENSSSGSWNPYSDKRVTRLPTRIRITQYLGGRQAWTEDAETGETLGWMWTQYLHGAGYTGGYGYVLEEPQAGR